MGEVIGLAIIAILGGMMLLSIGCITYLTAQKSEQDIDVYELIGASRRFIKRPFLYTGFYCRHVGSSHKLAYSIGTFRMGKSLLATSQTTLYLDLSLSSPSWVLITTSFVAPVFLGVMGAQLALHQFFKRRQQLQAST